MSEGPKVERRWYHLDDVAKRLGVDVQTVRRLLKSGKLEGVQFGGKTGWRVSEQGLAAFIARKQLLGATSRLGADGEV